MIAFMRANFEMPHRNIDLYKEKFRKLAMESKNQSKLSASEKNTYIKILESTRSLCDKLELNNSAGIVRQINQDVWPNDNFPFHHAAEQDLRRLWNAMESDMASRWFAFIPEGRVEYFEREQLFGDKVFDAFPSAREDVKSAGNCLAADMPDGAVFYLMRIMEIGLRALARNLKAKTIIKKLKPSHIPIELGTWEEIISTLENKVDELQNQPRTKKRDKKYNIIEKY
jgi:hypothetical protein